jgi:hypothetical protein
MPKSPKTPSKPTKGTPSETPNVDKGVGDRELEDRVGRRPDEKPDMVPPGQGEEPEIVGRPDEDEDDTRDVYDRDTIDPEALEADRATARRSDRRDARDGVDPSDTLPMDPDAVGGKL